MAPSSRGAGLLGNSFWNATAFGVGVVLNLLILPFVVARLGVAIFGVAGLVMASVAPALAFSNALSLATARELALRLAPERREDARQVFSTALLLALGIGAALALLVGVAGPRIAARLFNLDAAIHDLDAAFAVGALGWLSQCVSAVCLAGLVARQDYRAVSIVAIVVASVSTLLIFVLVPGRPLASTYLGCLAAGYAAGLLIAIWLMLQRARAWMPPPAFHRAAFRDLIRIGGWQFAAQAGGLFAGQADRYLLGMFLQPQYVGFYTVAQRLEEAVYIGILKVGEILFPFFSVIQDEPAARRADLVFRASWILNLLAACALGGLITIAGPLLELWTGVQVAAEAQLVMVVLAAAGLVGCSANVLTFYLLASGRSRANAAISLVTAVVTIAVSATLLPTLGWQAAGFSSLLGMFAQIAVTLTLLRNSFASPDLWSRIGHAVILPLVVGIGCALIFRALVPVDPAPRWWYVGLQFGLAAALILVIIAGASRFSRHGASSWKDMLTIMRRFIPARAL